MCCCNTRLVSSDAILKCKREGKQINQPVKGPTSCCVEHLGRSTFHRPAVHPHRIQSAGSNVRSRFQSHAWARPRAPSSCLTVCLLLLLFCCYKPCSLLLFYYVGRFASLLFAECSCSCSVWSHVKPTPPSGYNCPFSI
jgi:hypothetical protein